MFNWNLTWVIRYKNRDHAHVMGVYNKKTINRYERHFLKWIDYNLYVSAKDYKR